jgi:hypothetical protein
MQILLNYVSSYERMLHRRAIEDWCTEHIGYQIDQIICEAYDTSDVRERALMKYATLTGECTPFESVRIVLGLKWRTFTCYNRSDKIANYLIEIDDDVLAVQFKLLFG